MWKMLSDEIRRVQGGMAVDWKMLSVDYKD